MDLVELVHGEVVHGRGIVGRLREGPDATLVDFDCYAPTTA